MIFLELTPCTWCLRHFIASISDDTWYVPVLAANSGWAETIHFYPTHPNATVANDGQLHQHDKMEGTANTPKPRTQTETREENARTLHHRKQETEGWKKEEIAKRQETNQTKKRRNIREAGSRRNKENEKVKIRKAKKQQEIPKKQNVQTSSNITKT